MDVSWLASGPVTCRQPQTRDGDKSKIRDKGLLKAVLNIIDVIAHKLLEVIGKAATDPLERKNRRRTEADDVELFLTPCRDHGVPWKHRKCQTKLTSNHHHRERKQADAHLQNL